MRRRNGAEKNISNKKKKKSEEKNATEVKREDEGRRLKNVSAFFMMAIDVWQVRLDSRQFLTWLSTSPSSNELEHSRTGTNVSYVRCRLVSKESKFFMMMAFSRVTWKRQTVLLRRKKLEKIGKKLNNFLSFLKFNFLGRKM